MAGRTLCRQLDERPSRLRPLLLRSRRHADRVREEQNGRDFDDDYTGAVILLMHDAERRPSSAPIQPLDLRHTSYFAARSVRVIYFLLATRACVAGRAASHQTRMQGTTGITGSGDRRQDRGVCLTYRRSTAERYSSHDKRQRLLTLWTNDDDDNNININNNNHNTCTS